VSAAFVISPDTTLAELSGMMRLLPEYGLRVRLWPTHVKTQRYEVSAHSHTEGRPVIVKRAASIWAALALVLEDAISQHIAASSAPEDEP
jgi:hypothetical protein